MPHRVATQSKPVPGVNKHQLYDRYKRDRDAKRFYNSRAWLMLRLLKLQLDPLCEPCKASGTYVPASIVHHKHERRHNPELSLALDNLESMCESCHSRLHAVARGGACTDNDACADSTPA
jgi:5-methylcytosine-specific restriction endonuclease McrA